MSKKECEKKVTVSLRRKEKYDKCCYKTPAVCPKDHKDHLIQITFHSCAVLPYILPILRWI